MNSIDSTHNHVLIKSCLKKRKRERAREKEGEREVCANDHWRYLI